MFGPFGMPGINLVRTIFPIRKPDDTAKIIGVDAVELIYKIHRCSHGHGDEPPEGTHSFRMQTVHSNAPGTRSRHHRSRTAESGSSTA